MNRFSRRAALGLGAAALLAACSRERPKSADELEAGYQSADQAIKLWAPADRGEPVALAGESMAGDPVDVAGWRGDVVVMNFWYAECPPCRKEAPDLKALAEEYADQGVHFLGVNHTNTPDTALAFERRFEIPYPTLDDQDAAGVAAVQGLVPLTAMPSTLVLDRQGRVAARIIGIADKSVLNTILADTLAESG